MRVDSQIPTGAGFGSSAAVAVAVADALLAFHGQRLDPTDLQRLTLEVERRQHGMPSGVDNATVIHGGVVLARRAPSGDLDASRLDASPLAVSISFLDAIRVYDSGPPAEPTGAVVAAVRRRFEAEPGRYEPIFDAMEATTLAARAELLAPSPSARRFADAVRAFEQCLEDLGVVPAPVREVIRQVEAAGGAAKISGAGALSGAGGGALLVFHPEPHRIDRWSFLDHLDRLDVRLGAAGLRRETSR